MFRRVLLSSFLWAAMACAIASPGLAQEPYPRSGYGSDVQPLDRILPTVRNGRPGQFYDAEGPFPDAYGGYHYRIKWLTPEGRVIWLDADARSGRVLGVARGDWRDRGPPPFSQGPQYGTRNGRQFEPGASPYGAEPRGPGGYGPAREPGGYGPPNQPGGYGAPPPQGGFGGPPPTGGFGGPPRGPGGFGGPPRGGPGPAPGRGGFGTGPHGGGHGHGH